MHRRNYNGGLKEAGGTLTRGKEGSGEKTKMGILDPRKFTGQAKLPCPSALPAPIPRHKFRSKRNWNVLGGRTTGKKELYLSETHCPL